MPLLALAFGLAACDRPAPAATLEIPLATLGSGDLDGTRVALDVRGGEDLVQPPGSTLDLYLALPEQAELRFRVEPPAAAEAVAVTVSGEGAVPAPAVTVASDGERHLALGSAPDAVVRLRFANGSSGPVRWIAPRVIGRPPYRPPPIDPGVARIATPNVILILIDALRADHLSLYGYPRPTTPQLDALASDATVFREAYAAGPRTLNSIPSLLTSQPASAVGVDLATIPAGAPTLAEVFRSAGYRTGAFLTNPLLTNTAGFARGYATYLELPHPLRPADYYWPRAEAVVHRGVDWIAADPLRPFFLYLHALDVHTPWAPPVPFLGAFAGDRSVERPARPARKIDLVRMEQAATMLAAKALPPGEWDRYDEAILYVDDQIGALVRALDDLDVRDRTLIVVTADHGEVLGNEDDGTSFHGHSLYEELVRVPLVLLWPRPGAPRRVDEVVSLLDVAPTLTDFARLPMPATWRGRSLLRAPAPDRPAAALFERQAVNWVKSFVASRDFPEVAEVGVRAGPWKLLREDGVARLFHLPTDPKETDDVAADRPEVAGWLTTLAWRPPVAPGTAATTAGAAPAGPSPAEVRRRTDNLRALGYVE